MKIKDVLTLVILAIVLISVGSLLVNVLGKHKQRRAEIEIVEAIDPVFSDTSRNIILGRDPKIKVEDFSSPIEIPAKFGNASPFSAE